ncbi:hypothetical protein [Methylobacterium durans]|uniref:Uncharacterized protein n=1 Tax=Methylobacterium durans TaxID=2202825 RepID=A0A2U8W2P8_9HYPH|nr:hypothetical protein [Methylobacterium durans]AWN39622.1 hypothetical protein DK389_02600 [Methylobacterium durans]
MTSRSLVAVALVLATPAIAASAAERARPAPPAGMALTIPWQGMALVADGARPPAGGFRNANLTPPVHSAKPIPPPGRLPDQRTGPKRDHVVRDICIGC